MSDALTGPEALFARLRAGDRRALARAITLVESTREDDRKLAEELLELALPSTGQALRVGVTGTPGVGKSTFIEALGARLCERGENVAVLAVDPSSAVSGGSILGDKTRMDALARHPRAFVRPQPSAGALGGTAPHTRDAMLLCEAAGFTVILVETVGVGQSEAAVADMTDTFVLLVAPGGGDELQGVKRGVLELVDVLLVNKADGEHLAEAERTRADYERGSGMFLRPLPGWTVPVLLVSARDRRGIDEAWRSVEAHRAALEASGALATRRAAQAERALWRALEEELLAALRADPAVRAALPGALDAVRRGARSPAQAARALLALRAR
jgi:LAO/AO transport system kinase